jgi:hypothetical protein
MSPKAWVRASLGRRVMMRRISFAGDLGIFRIPEIYRLMEFLPILITGSIFKTPEFPA